MAVTPYIRNISATTNGLDEKLFEEQIEDEVSIVPAVVGIGRNGDGTFTTRFDPALSAGEETTFDGLVAAHDKTAAVKRIRRHHVGYAGTKKSTPNLTYTRMSIFTFDGRRSVGIPDKAEAVLRTLGTGWIRIIDIKNGDAVVCETSFTNSANQTVDLGTISNLPKGPSVFEIQLKSTTAVDSTISHMHFVWWR